MTGSDKVRCAFCGWHLQTSGGRLPRHAVDGRTCLGSGRAVSPVAFGHVRRRIPMGGTTCMACGQRAEVMTVHDQVHAVWPCGDSFPAGPAEPATPATPVTTSAGTPATVPAQQHAAARDGVAVLPERNGQPARRVEPGRTAPADGHKQPAAVGV